MKKALVWVAALGLTLAACKTMEPRPQPPPCTDCGTQGGPPPTLPPRQKIPETGTVPPVPKSTQVVVGFCPATGQYQAMGVDTDTRQFTFLWQGGRATQPVAFARFYEARVPVTVYTAPVKLAGRGGRTPAGAPTATSALAPAPGSPAPAQAPAPLPTPPPPPEDSPESDPGYDPCETISEEPPPSPKPGGSQWEPTYLTTFQNVAWHTAYALDAVTNPVAPSTAPGVLPAPQ